YCEDTYEDLEALGYATNSVSGTDGKPFVYYANSDGSGLSDQIVQATVNLANHLRLDVDFECVDNAATAIDECQAFDVEGVPAGGACPSTCLGGMANGTCYECAPGTELTFDVFVKNVGVMKTGVPQVFTFEVRLVAEGLSTLSSLPVTVV